MSGLSCSTANVLFFEAQAFGVQEAPNRVLAQRDATCGKVIAKLPNRAIRMRDDEGMDKLAVRGKAWTPVAAILARPDVPRLPLALAPAHDSRHRHTKPRRHDAATPPFRKRRHNTLAQIK